MLHLLVLAYIQNTDLLIIDIIRKCSTLKINRMISATFSRPHPPSGHAVEDLLMVLGIIYAC